MHYVCLIKKKVVMICDIEKLMIKVATRQPCKTKKPKNQMNDFKAHLSYGCFGIQNVKISNQIILHH